MATLSARAFLLKDEREVIIRSLSKKDAPLAQAFNDQVGLESTGTMRYPGQKPIPVEDTARTWASDAEDTRALNIGAFDNNRIVGILFFRCSVPNHPWCVHNGHFGMMILKEYWRQGLGKELLRLQEEFARAVGYTHIGAKVRDNNKDALSLYESVGYRVSGKMVRDAMINGEYVDSLIISKTLE